MFAGAGLPCGLLGFLFPRCDAESVCLLGIEVRQGIGLLRMSLRDERQGNIGVY